MDADGFGWVYVVCEGMWFSAGGLRKGERPVPVIDAAVGDVYN